MEKRDANGLFAALKSQYGPQGWWPLASRSGMAGFDAEGYHLDSTRVPNDLTGRFEIFCGAILTQNTAWRNVAMVLKSLREHGLLDPQALVSLEPDQLALHIRSAGYHNQKSRKLLAATQAAIGGLWLDARENAPTRTDLLALWGIGPETADSMLLYIWDIPTFVVDAYTRRLLSRLGWPFGFNPATAGYETLRHWFMSTLGKNSQVFNEFHALIVEHGKRHCSAKPVCSGCPLLNSCATAVDK